MNKKILEEENQYFSKIKKVVCDVIRQNEKTINSIDKENKELRQFMLENIELDMELGDIDVTNIVNSERMRVGVNIEQDLRKKNQALEKVKDSPFFAKIGVSDENTSENYYIGLQNITKNQKLYVVDWRAPICSLYYHSLLGKAEYSVFTETEQKITVNLNLKRQFEIENNKIKAYYDADDKVNDKLLINILSQNTNPYMKNIVRSIQSEQNTVIRKKLNKDIIVQGVAGSGKTSIAMHRIAYLLYDNSTILNKENILFITPNKLFAEYISKLLPELGEENVNTYTFFEAISFLKALPKNSETKAQLTEQIISGSKIRKDEYEQKFSSEYAKKLKKHIANILSKKFVAKIIEPVIPLMEDVLNKIYYTGTSPYKIFERMNIMINRLCSYYGMKKTQTKKIRAKILRSYKDLINADEIYYSFMKKQKLNPNKELCDNFSTQIFLNLCLFPYETDNTIKHIVVDEMQDYDMLSYEILKTVYPSASFSILGDENQSLIVDNFKKQDLQSIFEESEVINLNISYRSTKNIMDFANKVLGINESANNLRTGKPVRFLEFNDNNLANHIKAELNATSHLQKIAVLCSSKKEAMLISQKLGLPVFVDDAASQIFDEKVIVSTTYLCKGLEFDKVIIILTNSLETAFERKTLYVALTRALHEAVIYCNNTVALANFKK